MYRAVASEPSLDPSKRDETKQHRRDFLTPMLPLLHRLFKISLHERGLVLTPVTARGILNGGQIGSKL